MDQDLRLRMEKSRRAHDGLSPLAVSSRRRALDRLHAAVETGRSTTLLVTGEAGAGKTWLTHRFASLLPAGWRATRVDLTSAMNALDFLQLIGHSLGVPLADSLGAARARLHAFLSDDAVDGRQWLLVVDEAHRGSPAVWDEIQAIVNQSGRPGGFGALVALGETELVRALATRGFGGFAASLRAHVHLGPLDLDEARELLEFMGYAEHAADPALEELHRDARGNPSTLLRLAQRRSEPRHRAATVASSRELSAADSPSRSPAGDSVAAEHQARAIEYPASTLPRAAAGQGRTTPSEPTSLIPTRPPIRIEDGLVEVGWDGELETELSPPDHAEANSATLPPDDRSFNEELVEDRYAALQAWSEWTKSQKREDDRRAATATPPSDAPEQSIVRAEPHSPATPLEPRPPSPAPALASAGVRAEPQHDFAPYSQLFTRLRQSKQP